jgi:SAM-dependent methyltransferase
VVEFTKQKRCKCISIAIKMTIIKKPPLQIVNTPFKRLIYLYRKVSKISLTRALQYELIESYQLNGETLDFGGGENSLYRNLLNCISYKSINIDPTIKPTWLIEVGSGLPCSDQSFDTVISLNTLEHIYKPYPILEEFYRVLKPGGEVLLSTPFLFPIHGHPDDFFRPTPSWYRHALLECGFINIDVHPLSWGPFSTGASCSGLPGPGRLMRRRIALILDYLYCKINKYRRSQLAVKFQLESQATGFFIRAYKK